MSNNAMSNETDLNWLARNVHVWPEGKCEVLVCWPRNVDTLIWSFVLSDTGWITKAKWLARRAELQNKPSWDAVPSHANWLAQDAAGSWLWHDSEPECRNGGWIGSTTRGYAAKGCVLGDWSDTLEKRPEEFKPFTSIEDNQELSMTQQEMKQDNGWFERGELPPVGCECEMKRIDGRWCKAVTVGKDSGGRMVCELNDNGVFYASTSSAESFRPIRTERDELIEIISSSLLVTTEQVADAIIAAGFKLEAK